MQVYEVIYMTIYDLGIASASFYCFSHRKVWESTRLKLRKKQHFSFCLSENADLVNGQIWTSAHACLSCLSEASPRRRSAPDLVTVETGVSVNECNLVLPLTDSPRRLSTRPHITFFWNVLRFLYSNAINVKHTKHAQSSYWLMNERRTWAQVYLCFLHASR